MREWVSAYNLPVMTVVTKMDYVPRSKTLNVINYIKKEFGGEVLPYSAVDNRYNEGVFAALLNLCDLSQN